MADHWRHLGWLTAAALAGWLAYELHWTPGVPAPPPLSADDEVLAPPALDVASPDLATLHVTLERPLFSDDRRPDLTEPGTAPGGESAAAVILPPVRLSGVIVAADGRRTVLVQPEGQGQGQEPPKPQRVGVGDQVAGWRIEEIGEEAVVMSGGGQRAAVPLRVFEAKPPGTPGRTRPRRRPPEPARPPAPKPAEAEAPGRKADAEPHASQPGRPDSPTPSARKD